MVYLITDMTAALAWAHENAKHLIGMRLNEGRIITDADALVFAWRAWALNQQPGWIGLQEENAQWVPPFVRLEGEYEKRDEIWNEGYEAAMLHIAGEAVHAIDKDDELKEQVRLLQEVSETRVAIRELFEDLELEGYEERLHLADLISKRLARQIQKLP